MTNFESADDVTEAESEQRWRQRWADGEKVFRRFNLLAERGYRPVFRGDDTVFELEHPNPKATRIQLWPDGQVVDLYPTTVRDGERTIIHIEDERLFQRFLENVPAPSPLARALSTRIGDALSAALGYLILFGMLGGVGAAASALWTSMFGR